MRCCIVWSRSARKGNLRNHHQHCDKKIEQKNVTTRLERKYDKHIWMEIVTKRSERKYDKNILIEIVTKRSEMKYDENIWMEIVTKRMWGSPGEDAIAANQRLWFPWKTQQSTQINIFWWVILTSHYFVTFNCVTCILAGIEIENFLLDPCIQGWNTEVSCDYKCISGQFWPFLSG